MAGPSDSNVMRAFENVSRRLGVPAATAGRTRAVAAPGASARDVWLKQELARFLARTNPRPRTHGLHNAPPTRPHVMGALFAAKGIRGRVFLVGETVHRGWTDGPVDVAVTDRSDERRIRAAARNYHVNFLLVRGTPSEPHIEVFFSPNSRAGGGVNGH